MSELPFGTWPSTIGADLVATTQASLAAPVLTPSGAFWCEGRPWENGRVVLLRGAREGDAQEVAPADFNLRTRVHEYGGRSYAVADDVIVGAEMRSQRLHRLDLPGPPVPLTPESEAKLRYADMVIDTARRRVIAVREDHRGAEVENCLVAVALDGDPDEGVVLHRGHDFCAAPALSADGRRLAWVTWDHPDMPWDATTLWIADLDDGGLPTQPRRVAGGPDELALQPIWLADGSLVYASDRSGWWNIWRWDGQNVTQVCDMAAEFAGPLWSIGTRWFAAIDDRNLAVTVSQDGRTRLARLDVFTGDLSPIDLQLAEVGEPSCVDGQILVLGAAEDAPPVLLLVDPATGAHRQLRAAGPMPVGAEWVARPQSIRFLGSGGRDTQAFFYPPTHPEVSGPRGEHPPLIVRSHGGPTSRGGAGLSLALQFWTSRGFAVVDVNYGGSTGFGREYRRRLDGQWGIVDVEDCIAAAGHLVAQGMADPLRLAIRGGSASGYTTLCALTFHEVFQAGASYYGIGDLESLARDTHKFEARYLDRLVGPWPERADIYRARSPIHHIDGLGCPVIFFQGLEDLAVPPNQAEAMVEALRAKSLPVAYLPFPGEGHGFRKAETVRAALEAEHAFICRVFGLAPEGGTTPLAIENLED